MKLSEIKPLVENQQLAAMSPAEYVMHTYYVYGGNDETDLTIEESKQKYRILIGQNAIEVLADDPINNRRAKEIRRDIINRTDYGQMDTDDFEDSLEVRNLISMER